MTLRARLIASFLFISLTTAIAMGGVAWWMLMRDFRQAVQEESFRNFRADMAAYLSLYGSWQHAVQAESFNDFVVHRRGAPPPGPAPGPDRQRPWRPPFRFLLLDPQGRVLNALEQFRPGSMVDAKILHLAQPITVDGRVEVLAAPVGEPTLSPEDRGYLSLMRKSLVTGIGIAVALSLLLGLLLGSRVSAALHELIRAIRAMRLDGGEVQTVPVRSNDEIGQLAEAFNRMSNELRQAHGELRHSNQTIQAQAQELRELSIRDPLTHLYNRRHFDEQSTTLYAQAIRHGRPLTVMLGDLDHFKAINDSYSHAVGDEVLRRLACLLLEHIRSSDVAARYGGEEFAIAFPESTRGQAAARCEELRRRIEAYPWREIHPDLKVSMSMGLSDTLALGNVEKMLAEADTRLYQAKSAGRNRVVAD